MPCEEILLRVLGIWLIINVPMKEVIGSREVGRGREKGYLKRVC